MSMFKTIESDRNGNSSEEVVRQIRDMIQRSDLNLGDRLPPERDLAKLLGVSRPTLRAGIRSLVALGVLQSRQGAGTFVVEADDSPTLDGSSLQMLAALHGFKTEEMFEARLALEMTIAGLAAERATGEELATISEEITGMFATLDEPEKFLLHDMNFHQSVAAASGNRILTVLMNMVAKILFDVRRKTVKNATDLKESAQMHREIYQAIRERDPKAARQAMKNHLQMAQKSQMAEHEPSE